MVQRRAVHCKAEPRLRDSFADKVECGSFEEFVVLKESDEGQR